jgi:hypothetical protein
MGSKTITLEMVYREVKTIRQLFEELAEKALLNPASYAINPIAPSSWLK